MVRFENALRNHIDKEDNGLFPAAAIALGGPEWVEVHDITPHSHDGGEPHVHPPQDDRAQPLYHDHDEPSMGSRGEDERPGHEHGAALSTGDPLDRILVPPL